MYNTMLLFPVLTRTNTSIAECNKFTPKSQAGKRHSGRSRWKVIELDAEMKRHIFQILSQNDCWKALNTTGWRVSPQQCETARGWNFPLINTVQSWLVNIMSRACQTAHLKELCIICLNCCQFSAKSCCREWLRHQKEVNKNSDDVRTKVCPL